MTVNGEEKKGKIRNFNETIDLQVRALVFTRMCMGVLVGGFTHVVGLCRRRGGGP